MSQRTQNRSKSQNKNGCTCGCTCAGSAQMERHKTFVANNEMQRSRSRRRQNKSNESSVNFSMNREMYDASAEDSFYDAPLRRKAIFGEDYDATYEDSAFDPTLHETVIDNNSTREYQMSLPHSRSQTRSPSAPQVRNVRRNLMLEFENSHRQELHELLDEESVNESLLELEDEPLSAPHLGYIYRVNSFR